MRSTEMSVYGVGRWAAGFAVALLFLTGAAEVASAQTSSPKVGVIDTQRIFTESAPGKRALAELRQLQEAKEQEVRTKQQEINDLRSRLNEGRLSLAEEKIAQLSTDLENKIKEFRRLQEDAAGDLEKKRAEVLEKIEAQVMPIINKVGKENGFTMIFRKFESGLIYVDEAIDITQQVIQRLDSSGGAAAEGR